MPRELPPSWPGKDVEAEGPKAVVPGLIRPQEIAGSLPWEGGDFAMVGADEELAYPLKVRGRGEEPRVARGPPEACCVVVVDSSQGDGPQDREAPLAKGAAYPEAVLGRGGLHGSSGKVP